MKEQLNRSIAFQKAIEDMQEFLLGVLNKEHIDTRILQTVGIIGFIDRLYTQDCLTKDNHQMAREQFFQVINKLAKL